MFSMLSIVTCNLVTGRTIANSPAAGQRDTVWIMLAVAAASWALDIDD